MSIYSRVQPLSTRLKERYLLNRGGSSKETYHIVLDLMGADFPFEVGDSIGVYPTNPASLVENVLTSLKLKGSEEIFDSRSKTSFSIRTFLATKANLSKSTSTFLKMLADKGAKGLDEFLLPENKPRLVALLESHHVGDLIKMFPGAHLSAQDLTCLLPLLPRFYSIASSPTMFPGEIHLTVAALKYSAHGEIRQGIGSHFLCELAHLNETPIPIYLQSSNGFTIPSDPNAPIIMIGPGTGIAPFRAFLQERIAKQHQGKNWLFFGERNELSDFYYSDYLLALVKQNHLRLDTAFSRDQAEKVYVQHKVWQERKELFEWMQNGAYLYVCGDANKMAKDVELMLIKVAQDQGNLIEEDAKQWLKNLRQSKRYLLDVY